MPSIFPSHDCSFSLELRLIAVMAESATETTNTNEEQQWPPIPQNLGGYPRLSALFGCHPNLATFRRFGRLNSLNLLYYQAQLVHLEWRLDEQCEADTRADNHLRRLYSQDWDILRTSGATEGGDCSQWQTVLAIREVLEKYSGFTEHSRQIRG